MKKVTIHGCSDDLVEVEGDIREEFSGDEVTLVFGDGTRIRADYGKDGLWHIDRVAEGSARYEKTFTASDADSDAYSDRVTLEGDLVSVDKVRSRAEMIDAIEGADWSGVGDIDTRAIFALLKNAGALR